MPSIAAHPLARLHRGRRPGHAQHRRHDGRPTSRCPRSTSGAVETIGLTLPELWAIDRHALDVAFADEVDARAAAGRVRRVGRRRSRSSTRDRLTPSAQARGRLSRGEALQGGGQLRGVGGDRGRALGRRAAPRPRPASSPRSASGRTARRPPGPPRGRCAMPSPIMIASPGRGRRPRPPPRAGAAPACRSRPASTPRRRLERRDDRAGARPQAAFGRVDRVAVGGDEPGAGPDAVDGRGEPEVGQVRVEPDDDRVRMTGRGPAVDALLAHPRRGLGRRHDVEARRRAARARARRRRGPARGGCRGSWSRSVERGRPGRRRRPRPA